MKRDTIIIKVLAVLFFFCATPVFAQSVSDLERKIDALSDEIESLKLGGGGAGSPDRVKVHGYGEVHFNHKPGGGQTEIDAHRFVIGIHAQLADWIHLNAEIDFEHAAQELEFEFGYLDFLLNPAVNARAGVVLVPVGFLNEFHEPNLFWSVERPFFHNRIIPTTWSAGGAGIFGTPAEGINYRLYGVASLQSLRPAGFDAGGGNGGGGNSGQFTGASGIRSGRLQVNERIAEDWAATGRLEVAKWVPGLQLGVSFYAGNTTHDIIEEGGFVFLIEGDMKYRLKWFEMNASIANIDINDSEAINAFCASAVGNCTSDVADNIFGWNVQAGVHLPQLMGWNTTHDIVPFFLFEKIRPQDSLSGVDNPNRANNFDVITVGVSYLPIPAVALKTDYQHFMLGDNTTRDQFNVGIAYMY